MTSIRDTQRSAVYDAEELVRTMFDRADERGLRTVDVWGSQVTLPIERKFASIESVQDYVDRVLALNWVRERWNRASGKVRVRARAGNSAAHYESDCATIAIPEHRGGAAWAFRELVILHELAHHLGTENPADPEESANTEEPAHPDSLDDPHIRTSAAHGPEYVDRYLDLVEEIIGPEAALVLRTSYLAGGVQIG